MAPGVRLRQAGVSETRSGHHLGNLRMAEVLLLQKGDHFVAQRLANNLPPPAIWRMFDSPLYIVPMG